MKFNGLRRVWVRSF